MPRKSVPRVKPIRKANVARQSVGSSSPQSPKQDVSSTSKAKKGKTEIKGRDPRPYLTGATPGLWATNHLEEAQQVKNWQFVAIRTLAKMCSQSDLKVHKKKEKGELEKRIWAIDKKIEFYKSLCGLRDRQVRELEAKRERLVLKAESTDGSEQERKPVESNDPLLRLLERPNPEWSWSTFIFACVQQLAATGSALVWCIRNELGVPVELYICPTGLMIPRMPTPDYPQGSYYLTPLSVWGLQPGELFQYGAFGAAMMTGAEIDARDVKKICYPHPVYLTDGMSPLTACSLWVDLAAEMDRAAWYAFQNRERPGLVFNRDPNINPSPDDIAQWREDLRADSAGTPNTGKHMVNPPGVTAENWSQSEQELEFFQSREQVRDMNLAIHAVAPIAAGISGADSYAAYYAALKQTSDLAVQPTMDLIAGELSEFLGQEFGGRREITCHAKAIDDPQLKKDTWATHISAGNAVTVGEYRAAWGFKPFGDERDDEFVGVKTSVRVAAADEDASTPGVQVGPDKSKDEGKGKSDEKTTGIRNPTRDAPPGRNGKHLNGDYAFLKRLSVLGVDEPEDRLAAALEKISSLKPPKAEAPVFNFTVQTPPTNLTFNDGAFRVEGGESPKVTFEKGAIQVDAPQVTNEVKVSPTPVEIQNIVQPTPIENTVQVAAPNVVNNMPALEVTAKVDMPAPPAAKVDVTIKREPVGFEFEHDVAGNVTKATPVTK
jgi:phage portal protein BeeE